MRLELAADWLVMAAWLTWLKSRLLLPDDEPDAEEGDGGGRGAGRPPAGAAGDPRRRRLAGGPPGARPRRVRPRRGGALTELDRSGLAANVAGLLRAYLAALRRGGGRRTYRPAALPLWSVQDALGRLSAMMGHVPDWTVLEQFLPDAAADPLARRAATASTLLAGLELARDGRMRLRQDQPFGPILLRGASPSDHG